MQIISFTISLKAVSDSPADRILRHSVDPARSAGTNAAIQYPPLTTGRIRGAVFAQSR
ncbi:MAG: hypothetical protein ACR2PZ_04105 [Pseudomonadales bacterium]